MMTKIKISANIGSKFSVYKKFLHTQVLVVAKYPNAGEQRSSMVLSRFIRRRKLF
jgi:hypothetical protein